MSEAAISEYAKTRGFHPHTLERWLSWQEADRDRLGDLAIALKISENHLRDLLDWLEEMSLRDKEKIHCILDLPEIASIETHPRLGRADKLKRIKEQLRRRRFPRLAALENSLAESVKALRLPAAIHLSIPPGLEGGRIKAELEAATASELKELSELLSNAAASEEMTRIFAILNGAPAEAKDQES